ncbi:hypothetical protein ABFA07_015106 [Porites harrisoni]
MTESTEIQELVLAQSKSQEVDECLSEEPLSWPSDGKQTYPAAFLLANRTDKPGCKPTPMMSKHTWRTWDEGNLY